MLIFYVALWASLLLGKYLRLTRNHSDRPLNNVAFVITNYLFEVVILHSVYLFNYLDIWLYT